ncbi:hypothetical protein [Nannocystis bainbridge]|uniref:Uncharacterized protein n=1 Tax=Nannocystis bainbridge TaxID=2995303 RepID=A0ABT5E2I7_9BACT|nr:hypothetical protein [Nannocystis bainbridge]MDC0719178.1 hypothetical protein [Nannocystis bainbridge]
MASPSRRRIVWFSLAFACACGPKPAAETTDATDSASTAEPGSTTGDTTVVETTSTTGGTSTTAGSTAPNPTTASPTTSDSGDSTGATGTPFITPPDLGGGGCPRAAASSCDPWTQNCPSDDKCAPSGGGCGVFTRTVCHELPDQPVPLGGICESEGHPLSGRNDCELGTTCWFIDPETLIGTCVSLCHGSPVAPDCSHVPGTACVLVHDGLDAPLCLPTCDPFALTCPEGHHCHPSALTPALFACTPDASLGAAFEACDKADCAAGLLCSESEAAAVECAPDTNCCTPLCDLDTPDCPGVGQVCLPYYEMGQAPAGLEDVGRCGLP